MSKKKLSIDELDEEQYRVTQQKETERRRRYVEVQP